MDRDGLADLAFLPIEVAQDHVDFERIPVEARGATQFFDRQIDLVGDEKVEPEDVVRRFAYAPAIDPTPVTELVALPCLADRQAHQEREERGEQRCVCAHPRRPFAISGPGLAEPSPRYESTRSSHLVCARRMRSTSSRAAPSPPRAPLTQWTRARTSSAASHGDAESPARVSTGRSSTSSPM